MLEPLVKTIEVPCSQKKAFTVFQGGYRQAWVVIFEGAYKAACEA